MILPESLPTPAWPAGTRLEATEIAVPLRRPIRSAAGLLLERRSVVVALRTTEAAGYGEAAPFPGYSEVGTAEILEAFAGDELAALPAEAAAALDQARWDLWARRAGRPLWEKLVATLGSGPPQARPVPIVGSMVAGSEAASRDVTAPTWVKVKVAPGDVEAAVALAIAGRYVIADGNGAFAPDAVELDLLDGAGVAVIEQPLPPADLSGHAALRSRLRASIVLDESVRGIGDVARIVAAGAADGVVVKPGRLGDGGALAAARLATARGLSVRVGGMFETSIGRAHVLAVAAALDVGPAEAAPPAWYLAADPVDHPLRAIAGAVLPTDRPGIGLVPRLDSHRREVVERAVG